MNELRFQDGNEEAAPPREDDEGLYGMTDTTVQEIAESLELGQEDPIREVVAELHTADLADLIEQLKSKHRTLLFEVAGDLIDPEVFSEIDESIRDDLVEDMDPTEIAAVVTELELDDAVHVLEDLEEEDQQDVLRELPAEDRLVIEQSLSYDEDSAGRLMQRDTIAVPEYWNIGQTIDYLRDTQDLPNEFYEIFVVDPRHHPVGTIPLDRAMRSQRTVNVRDIMNREQKLIPVDMDQEEVAYLFQQYRLASAAVVNESGALIGMITVDDIVDVINEEAEEDILRLGGVSEDDLFGSIMGTTRTRFTWLLVNLLTAVLASIAIGFFDATMEKIIALAVLMPIVASMGGNAGTQTLTVAVRALATRELTSNNMFRILGKEAIVAFLNGTAFAILIGLVAWIWFGDLSIGWVIAVAMVVNMLVAGVAGMAIPIALDHYKIDPAVASSVFVTTITDIIGFVAFLGIATLVLL
ncbi:magnesium transporter [Sneathiella chinensis]|uniref:Magnesium transporter MgtE n=1 Tax=Sneathiella chinensis TaxID=349750 RepID=A0ABQ5U8T4_9PROT|nr:magnesium transporter [Sneathiella chinensis]GLQ07737.1 magnesium transporter MgtE [Sneathiella chinensis]